MYNDMYMWDKCFLWQMVTKYGSDPEITALVDKFDWYLMPLANPDGYDYSHDTVRPWPSFPNKD